MNVDKIRLSGLSNIDLPITNLDPTSKYILKAVDGLGPPEIEVYISKTLMQNSKYQGSSPNNREVVMRIRLNPNYAMAETVEGLRHALYGMLSKAPLEGSVPSAPPYIQLYYKGNMMAQVGAYVKRFEIVPFSKDPEVQITFACLGPFLDGPSNVSIDVGSLSTANPEIMSVGSAPSGFRVEVVFLSNSPDFYLQGDPNFVLKMDIVYSFLTNDHLIIDTRPGYRGIWVVRGGNTYNIIGSLMVEKNVAWLQFTYGSNKYKTYDEYAFDWVSWSYLPKYWGI
jgi:hypothetical protein